MGTVKGFVLDSALHSIAKDIVAMQDSGVVINVDQTIKNWNEKHSISSNTDQLQNDVNLFIKVERKRQLSSINALGYASYKAEHYVEKAKKLMSSPSESNAPDVI